MYKGHKIIALCITQLHNEMNYDFVYALNNILNKCGYRLLFIILTWIFTERDKIKRQRSSIRSHRFRHS